MIEVTIHYYGLLADQRGLMTEKVMTAVVDALELYQNLSKQYHFSVPVDCLRVAINDELVSWHTTLKNGDDVVFMPPMSGG